MPAAGPPRGPLDGITVVDLAQTLAGPFCTKTLYDLGARVIKVEPRDVFRLPKDGQFGKKGDVHPWAHRGNVPPYFFASIAYGKESIGLDLKDAGDRATFEKLLGTADVLVENYRGGVMEKLGYGWDALHARFPRLIYCSVTGFGEAGGAVSPQSGVPYNRLPAYNHIAEAMSGMMEFASVEGAPPHGNMGNTADVYSGTVAVIGVQSALISRARDGVGRRVDISMLDANISLLSHIVARHEAYAPGPHPAAPSVDAKGPPRYPHSGGAGKGIVPARTGAWWYMNSVFDVYECKDGKHLQLIAMKDTDFEKLCGALGRPEWAKDKRYQKHDARLANYAALLRPAMRAAMLERTRDEWLRLLQPLGMPAGPVNTVAEMLRDPQVVARNMVGTVHDSSTGQEWTVPGNPVKVSGFPDAAFRGTVHRYDEDGASIRARL